MSGPKVFQLVSLDEARRSWNTWLVEAESALEHWVSTCQRIGAFSERVEKDQRTRLARLRTLVQADKFDGLIAEGVPFLKYLEADLAARLDNAASRNLAREKALSSASTTAGVLLKMARESEVELPEQTAVLLRHAADRGVDNLSAVEEAILVAATLIQPSGPFSASAAEKSANQIELVEEWLQRTGYLLQPPVRDMQRQSVERLLCELIGLGHVADVESFRRRLVGVLGQSDESRRILALEVLSQELQQTVERARSWGKMRQRAEGLRAEAEQAGVLNMLEDAILAFEQAFEQRQEAAASAAIGAQRTALDAAIAGKNAELRRVELLHGLMQLGYTVNTGLSKIWSAQRQVVIRKSVQSATGLELSGDLTTGKCQVRVVSLDAAAAGDGSVDGRQAEEQWCSELSELQQNLGKRGVSLVVERATPAGVVPLKPAKSTWVSDFAGAEAANDGVQNVGRERRERSG